MRMNLKNQRDDFFASEGISSYYDKQVDKIQVGDLIVTEDKIRSIKVPSINVFSDYLNPTNNYLRNSLTPIMIDPSMADTEEPDATGTPPDLPRSSTAPTTQETENTSKKHEENEKKAKKKDFAGQIITETILQANKMEELREYKETMVAFSRYLSEYIIKYLSTAISDPSIIVNGFQIKSWNSRSKKSKKNTKKKEKIITEKEKEEIIEYLLISFSRTMEHYYSLSQDDLLHLFFNNPAFFYEFRIHLEFLTRQFRSKRSDGPFVHLPAAPHASQDLVKCNLIKNLRFMRERLLQEITLNAISPFSPSSKDTFIRWCFWNEDKVWRNRGGRSENTVNDFLSLIYPSSSPSPSSPSPSSSSPPCLYNYPGVCYYFNGFESALVGEKVVQLDDCSNNVLAYTIGEFIDPSTYEIITSWSHPNFSHLRLAINVCIYCCVFHFFSLSPPPASLLLLPLLSPLSYLSPSSPPSLLPFPLSVSPVYPFFLPLPLPLLWLLVSYSRQSK